jgi:hypothetical protein
VLPTSDKGEDLVGPPRCRNRRAVQTQCPYRQYQGPRT